MYGTIPKMVEPRDCVDDRERRHMHKLKVLMDDTIEFTERLLMGIALSPELEEALDPCEDQPAQVMRILESRQAQTLCEVRSLAVGARSALKAYFCNTDPRKDAALWRTSQYAVLGLRHALCYPVTGRYEEEPISVGEALETIWMQVWKLTGVRVDDRLKEALELNSAVYDWLDATEELYGVEGEVLPRVYDYPLEEEDEN